MKKNQIVPQEKEIKTIVAMSSVRLKQLTSEQMS